MCCFNPSDTVAEPEDEGPVVIRPGPPEVIRWPEPLIGTFSCYFTCASSLSDL